MAIIEKHISDLLCLHDCVIVPGLGGFVANHSPALVVEDRHLFIPPAKEIGFNRSLSHNDGLLVNHLCRREGYSYQEGMEKISSFVSELMETVDGNESRTLNGIGDLRKDTLGNMLFVPHVGSSFSPDSYGLGQFQFEPLQSVSAVSNSDEPVRRLLKSRSPRYWASVAAMMAGLFFFTSELKMPEKLQMNQGSVFSMSMENSQPTISEAVPTVWPVESELDEASESGKGPESNIMSSSQEKMPVPHSRVKGYHLIAASFANVQPAQKVLDQLHNNGYPDACLVQGANDRFRVALCSFSNKSDALEHLYQLREMPRFREVWLWKH